MSFCEEHPELCKERLVQKAYGKQVTPVEYGLNVEEAGEAGVSKAIQSGREDADINNIVARFHQTGFLPEMQKIEGLFQDVSDLPDYRSVVERVARVNEVFMELPAHIRAEFKNDAAEFVDFMSNDENRARGIELGLIEPDAAAPVDEVPGAGVQARDPVTGQFTSPK